MNKDYIVEGLRLLLQHKDEEISCLKMAHDGLKSALESLLDVGNIREADDKSSAYQKILKYVPDEEFVEFFDDNPSLTYILYDALNDIGKRRREASAARAKADVNNEINRKPCDKGD